MVVHGRSFAATLACSLNRALSLTALSESELTSSRAQSRPPRSSSPSLSLSSVFFFLVPSSSFAS